MNLPNKLTMARIIMVPVVVIVYLCIPTTVGVVDAKSGLALRDILAFFIFAIASLTDLLDGKIARKNNLITSFGKFADPIADKLLVNTLLIMMASTRQASLIAVLLMTARDLIVDGLRMVASQHGRVVSAGIYGKAKTVLQMVALCFLLLRHWPFSIVGIPIGTILLWLATIMSLYSGYVYFIKLKKYVLESI